MNHRNTTKTIAAAIVATLAAVPIVVSAASHSGAAPMDKKVSDRMVFSDRSNAKAWATEKEQLEKALQSAADRSGTFKALTDMGYMVTAINADRPEYLEYEIVKGNNSYEVQIDFDKGMPKAKKVDVTTNLWRADATKAAMRGDKVVAATKVDAANARFSDRQRMKAWSGEKEHIEKALAVGQNRQQYETMLKKMGYQITSVNDAEKDYLEYEVVKGDHSYEVQIDLDNKVGKKVDVTTNVWETAATEKALAANKRK